MTGMEAEMEPSTSSSACVSHAPPARGSLGGLAASGQRSRRHTKQSQSSQLQAAQPQKTATWLAGEPRFACNAQLQHRAGAAPGP